MSRTAATDPLVRQPPERIPGRDAHMAVRVNVLQNIREQQFSRIAVCVSLLFNLPQIIGVIVVLTRHWDPEACDKPLALWALIYAIRLSLSLLLALSILHPNQNALSPTFIKTRDALNFIAFIWFILGNWWILNTQTCHQLAPAVYQLCLILLIVNYIVIFLPCILLIAFIPIVCFCLPCLIRVMQMLEVQRGAEESAIRELPSTEYHRGMFAEDNLECAICLSTYEEGEQIRQLSCHPRHHFHKTCIDDWLRINDSCPTCRAPIVASSQHPTDPNHEQQSQRVAGMV